jgi:hypothetical protein
VGGGPGGGGGGGGGVCVWGFLCLFCVDFLFLLSFSGLFDIVNSNRSVLENNLNRLGHSNIR